MANTATPQDAKLFKFFIYETDDEGQTLVLIGDVEARDRDHALRLFLPDTREGLFLAISEAALKLKVRRLEVKHSVKWEDADAPEAPAPTEAVGDTPDESSDMRSPELVT